MCLTTNTIEQYRHNTTSSDTEPNNLPYTVSAEERALFLEYIQSTDYILEKGSLSHVQHAVHTVASQYNDSTSHMEILHESLPNKRRKSQIHTSNASVKHATTPTTQTSSQNKANECLSIREQKIPQKNTNNHIGATRQTFHTKLVEHPRFFVKSFRYDIPHYVKEQLETLHTSTQQIRNTIDLHKMTLLSAYTTVIQFIQQNYSCNAHVCCIITGKGRHSLYNKSFLRQALIEWLLSYPISEVLYGFISPAKSNGGEGAIALFLQPYNPQLRIQWHIRSDFCTY